ncbi:MAG: Allantoinase [Pseudonocardiales bacterium]|nr:Allantoinase [Pseudonocardiales bacterium]
MLDLAIVGGIVVTPEGPSALDVGVTEGLITHLVAPGALPEAARTVDASAKLVLPGGVDPHVHTNAPGGMPNVLGRDVIGLAALYGGMTTFIDFIWPGEHSPQTTLDDMIAEWDGTSYTDYGFHIVMSDQASDEHIDQIPALIEQGFPSFKIFTTNITPTQFEGFRTSTGTLFEILTRTAAANGIVDIHAEDDELVMHQYRKHFEAGKTDIVYMPDVHTTLSEDLSFRHVLQLASHIDNAAVYMHHVTAKTGVDAVRQYRATGQPIYAETLAVLTLTTAASYAEPDGHKYHIYPSIKFEEDVEAIWAGIADGHIHTFGTDGVCCLWEEKDRSRTIDGTFGGVTGVEPKMALLYTEMVRKRDLGLKRLVEVTSENAAKIFGLYPRKGAVLVGSDADFVILDPEDRRVIDPTDMHEGDYTPWGGREVYGWPVATILGGRVVIEGGVLVDDSTGGQLLRRTLDPSVARGTAVD